MTKCTSCGKDHGMVIEDMTTGEIAPIDWCKECLFVKGYTIKAAEPIQLNEDSSFVELGKALRKSQHEIILDMIRYSDRG